MSETKSVEVLICATCNGQGVTHHDELVCYHKRDYDYWSEKCKLCDGSGLVQKTIIINTTFEPFTPKEPEPRHRW